MKQARGGDDYRAWKADVATEMERQHDIAASIIPDHVWTKLYVKSLTPEHAANAPELQNYITREPGERFDRSGRLSNRDRTSLGRESLRQTASAGGPSLFVNKIPIHWRENTKLIGDH